MAAHPTAVDVVIVGAGSSGCTLAARLSEDPQVKVLLLEAGPWDWNPIFHIPLASGKALREGWYGWQFQCEPDDGLDRRAISFPRGRVVGGSSSINGMVYVRGHAADFDAWAAEGNPGWSYADVLPLFKRSEGHATRGDPFHGREGPLGVTVARGTSPTSTPSSGPQSRPAFHATRTSMVRNSEASGSSTSRSATAVAAARRQRSCGPREEEGT